MGWGQREKRRERNIHVRQKYQSVAYHTCPNQGPNPQPRRVHWPGIKPVNFRFAERCPTNWATATRVGTVHFQYGPFHIFSPHCLSCLEYLLAQTYDPSGKPERLCLKAQILKLTRAFVTSWSECWLCEVADDAWTQSWCCSWRQLKTSILLQGTHAGKTMTVTLLCHHLWPLTLCPCLVID